MNPKVFVFGAGFSKDIANYPTLEELTEEVLEIIEDESNVNSEAKEIAEFIIKRVPSGIKNNIEHTLTYLYQEFPWRTEKENLAFKSAYQLIVEKLPGIFDNIARYKKVNKSCDEAQKLIDYCRRYELPIITFNYDTLIEYLYLGIKPKSQNNYLDFAGLYQYPMKLITEREPGGVWWGENDDSFPLFKLHGSINWFYSSRDFQGSQIYFSPVIEAENLRDGSREMKIVWEEMSRISKCKTGLLPLIVPPVLDKSIYYVNNIIKVQWEKAMDYLSEANEIYILGYSLPETDLATKFLFQKALFNNSSKLHVIIKDDDKNYAKTTEKRYLSILDGNIDRLEFINVDSNKSSLQTLTEILGIK